MSRTRLVLSGIAITALISITGFVATPANASTISNTKTTVSTQAIHPNSSKIEKFDMLAAKTIGGVYVNVAKYPSPNSTLSSIAKRIYGNASLWTLIYNANRNQIKNPNVVFYGQRLYVPVLNSSVKPAPVAKPPAPVVVSSNKTFNPLPGASLTSCFGPRWGTMHKGIDMAKPTGTAIHVVGSGIVVKAGWVYSGYGISVMVKMDSGGVYSHYAHMSRLAVGAGQRVNANQVIGYVGATGDVTGPHLHFEIHQGSIWNQINPAPWLRAHGVAIGC